MELDFSLLNQRRAVTEPTQKTETNPGREYKTTPQAEKLAEALKRALNEEPEKEAYADEDISKYCEEAQRQLRAMMILQYAADHIKEMTAEESFSQALRAVSLILQENYINLFLEAIKN